MTKISKLFYWCVIPRQPNKQIRGLAINLGGDYTRILIALKKGLKLKRFFSGLA